MGLIRNALAPLKDPAKAVGKSASDSLMGGIFNVVDQAMYQEYITSGSMTGDILMKRGEKVNTSGRNTKSDANIITSGSVIDVQENQCMIIVENGKVVEGCMEPGRFIYDTTLAPSFFGGSEAGFGEKLKNVAVEMWEQAKMAGQRRNTQRIYFINMGVLDEPFHWGLGNVPFRHCSKISDNAPAIRINMMLKANGLAKVRIADPMAFYTQKGAQKAGGDNDGKITLAELQDTLFAPAKSSIREAISMAVQQAGRQAEIAYTDILSFENADTFKQLVNERMKESELALCGFEFSQFSVNGGFVPREEDYKKLSDMEERLGEKAFMASDDNLRAYDVQKTLAGNEGMAGQMAGMGMVMNGGFGQIGPQFGYGQQAAYGMGVMGGAAPQAPAATAAPAADTWTCSCGATATGKFCANCGNKKPEAKPANGWTCSCGATATGKFCPECGAKKPEAAAGWACACGHVNLGKFCQECGAKKPAAAPLYRCDKCGWEPEDPKNPPKFCPECGDRFDDGDVQ